MTQIYDVTGSGVPVVFLHAGMADRRMWRPQWTEFGGTNQLVRIDQRGFGDNPPTAAPFNRAIDVIEILESLGIEQAVMVGGSMGGRVSLEVAVRRPDMVTGLLLLGSAIPGHDWSDQVQAMWRDEEAALNAGDLDAAVNINLDFWLDGPDRDRADLSESDRDLVADMQRKAFKHELAHLDAAPETPLENLGARLGEITVPARVTYGNQDAADIAAIAEKLVAVLPHATLHEIDDAAHLPSLEKPAQVNQLLNDLLAAVS